MDLSTLLPELVYGPWSHEGELFPVSTGVVGSGRNPATRESVTIPPLDS